MTDRFVAIVMAAGQGTRMKSPLAKVLHPVAGRPLFAHVVDAALGAGAKRAVQQTVDAIDPRKITDSKIRSWLKRDIGGVLRAMNQADFDIKALPPATKED